MENLFEKKICQKCKKEFYASKTANNVILCSTCQTRHHISNDSLHVELKQKEHENDWVNLERLIKKYEKPSSDSSHYHSK